MNCPICAGDKVVWQGNDLIGTMKCVPCPLCNSKINSKENEQMENIDEIQQRIAVPIVASHWKEYLQSEAFKSVMASNYSDMEKKEFMVLDIYKQVKLSLLEIELKALVEKNCFSLAIKRITDLTLDNLGFQQEFYSLLQKENRQEQNSDSIMSNYYGMMRNEDLNLLDVVEKAVDAAWIECSF